LQLHKTRFFQQIIHGKHFEFIEFAATNWLIIACSIYASALNYFSQHALITPTDWLAVSLVGSVSEYPHGGLEFMYKNRVDYW